MDIRTNIRMLTSNPDQQTQQTQQTHQVEQLCNNLILFWQVAKKSMNPQFKMAVQLDTQSMQRISTSESFLQRHIKRNGTVYGVNTGVGHLCNHKICEEDLSEFQHRIIRSHCCGVGEAVSRDIVFAMWLIFLNSTAKGHRAVRRCIVDQIIQSLNLGILGIVPSRGSVGASGDLAPAAHAALTLIGEGLCTVPNGQTFKTMSSSNALKEAGLTPVKLGPKEGLSLINGTQYSTAIGIKLLYEASVLLAHANLCAAMSMVALRAKTEFLDDRLIAAHNHPGTLACGRDIRAWRGPEPRATGKSTLDSVVKIQDPYSIRCSPQVHGALWQEIRYSEETLRNEVGACTDNPIVFAEEGCILHGGNFHAINPGRVCDKLASALTTVASISERRVNISLNTDKSGLPQFLINDCGLNSGLMMIQVTAAALVSECKSLSIPATIDSIPTNCDQEDHVSMAPGAGLKALQVANLVKKILAIELLVSCQAIDMLGPGNLAHPLSDVYHTVRSRVSYLDADRVISNDIEELSSLIESEELLINGVSQ